MCNMGGSCNPRIDECPDCGSENLGHNHSKGIHCLDCGKEHI